MNADEYRALVNKLEAINEAPIDDMAPGAQDDATGVDAAVAAQAASTGAGPDLSKYKPNDGIPEIQARSLAQAHQIAAKQGLKAFRWCSTYKTNIKKPQGQSGKRTNDQKVDFLGQQTPLGGTMSNPMSFAPNSGFGA